jgi:predicted GIY-YIG superfamily endonuclease
MSWFVYILRCTNGSYYVGHTSNPEARFLRHRNNEGAQYTATYPPEAILYKEQFDTEADAIRREQQLKRWTRAKKEALMAGNTKRLRSLSISHD